MLVDLFPPVVGGKEIYVSELSKELVKKGHNVSVVTLSVQSYNLPLAECVDGINILRVSGSLNKISVLYGGSVIRPNLPIGDISLGRQLADIVSDFRPDVIVCHSNFLYSVRSVAAKRRIPLIVTLHDYGFICPIGNLLFRHLVPCTRQYSRDCLGCVTKTSGGVKAVLGYILYKMNRPALKAVDKYVAVSQAVKDIYLGATGLPADKIDVIYNFYKGKNEGVLPDGCKEQFPEKFILYVGSFSKQKGIHVLLDAFRGIRSRIPSDIKLVMVVASEEGEIPICEDGVHVMVNQPRAVVMEAWKRCLFGVIPSIWLDPCPTVALEAMSEGKALVASAVGGLKEMIVHKLTGLIVPPGDVGELGNSLLFLLGNFEISRLYGSNARDRFEKCFTAERALMDYEELFKGAVSRLKHSLQ